MDDTKTTETVTEPTTPVETPVAPEGAPAEGGKTPAEGTTETVTVDPTAGEPAKPGVTAEVVSN